MNAFCQYQVVAYFEIVNYVMLSVQATAHLADVYALCSSVSLSRLKRPDHGRWYNKQFHKAFIKFRYFYFDSVRSS